MSPTYEYKCKPCLKTQDIIKSVSEYDTKEFCTCGKEMDRLISKVNINASVCQFQAHHDSGLGVDVHSKIQKDNELAKIRGETGKDIIEIGNDDFKTVKRQRKEYTYDRRIDLEGEH